MSTTSFYGRMILGFGLLLLVGAQAQAANLERLNREIKFELVEASTGKTSEIELLFTHWNGEQAFYQGGINRGDDWWDESVLARIQAKKGSSKTLEIEILFNSGDEYFVKADLALEGSSARVLVTEQGETEINWECAQTLPEDSAAYWYDYAATSSGSNYSGVENGQYPILAAKGEEGILGNVRRIGKLDFSPCDGCEHGDQMFLESAEKAPDVNVIALLPAKYYEADCEGTLHPSLIALLEAGVDFTFEGRLTSLTSDYWEGNFWTAVPGGKLTVGAEGKLSIEAFLDRVLERTEFAEVKFTKGASAETLDVTYAGGAFGINLRTGKILETEK